MPGSNSRPNVSEGYEVPTELPGSTGCTFYNTAHNTLGRREVNKYMTPYRRTRQNYYWCSVLTCYRAEGESPSKRPVSSACRRNEHETNRGRGSLECLSNREVSAIGSVRAPLSRRPVVSISRVIMDMMVKECPSCVRTGCMDRGQQLHVQ